MASPRLLAPTLRIVAPDLLAGIRNSASYKWWVFATIAIGTFVSVVDNGSVLIALPDIERHFQTNLPAVQWVVVGNALAISALILPMGRLGDIVGRKWVYVCGLLIFVVGSALAGLSPNLPWLVSSKVFQGAGSAMIQGNGMAMAITAFAAAERGKALGSHMSVVGAGAIAGPAMGGLLVAAFGWSSVFFVSVPIGILTILAAWFVLEQPGSAAGEVEARPGLDWTGAGLSGVALLGFLLVVGNGQRLGWGSPAILGGSLATTITIVAFVWWELRCSAPMLDLRLFRRKLVAMGVMAGWLSFLGSQAARFMMPFYMQRVLELSPRDVGLLLIPPALCMVVLGPVSGRLSDRFGWRVLTVMGLVFSATTCFIFAAGLTESSSVVLIVAMLSLQSSGTALFNSPNNSSIFGAVSASQFGVVSSLTQLVRNSANVTSIAIATVVVAMTMGSMGVEPSLDAVSPAVADAFVAGLKWAFLLTGGLLVIAIALAIIRGERRPAELAAASAP